RGRLHAEEVFIATNGYTGGGAAHLPLNLTPAGGHTLATQGVPADPPRRLVPPGHPITHAPRAPTLHRRPPDRRRTPFRAAAPAPGRASRRSRRGPARRSSTAS